MSAGKKFRDALTREQPLAIVGAINAFAAIMAEKTGFQAIYLSGAGVANASYGMPDLGMTTLTDVLIDVARITSATNLPLLVDADTGWEEDFGIAHTVSEMIAAGSAGIHIEDQVSAKRCGHRDGKTLVTLDAMQQRLQQALDARYDPDFVIMARTDAYGVEGLDAAITRAQAYAEVGADMIFIEALDSLEAYQKFTDALHVPVLANMTEFGKTPIFSQSQFNEVGIDMVLYPLSAFRAMNQAALDVYQTIRTTGSQQSALQRMQTRQELYDFLDYETFEQQLDQAKGEK